ncbi:MAG TPA: methyltransferase [Pirellulales bacterium]|nr:methyltransferase [Pirellulales bacterium]
MPLSATTFPEHDPVRIFELCRASYATELLAAAVAEFRLFERLAPGAKPAAVLRAELHLAERPFAVLITAMRAMELLCSAGPDQLQLTPLAAEHLLPGGPFFVGDYVGLSAASPGVQALVARLKSNQPAPAQAADQGAAFIYREGLESAMDHADSARRLTLALAGRAKNVAPFLAARANLEQATCLLDIGGGTGIYAIACLQRFPRLKAIVWDRPEVLKIAREFAIEYGVADRLEGIPGDMFADPLPPGCDVQLISNVLHDWDVPECEALLRRCAAALPAGGRILIHDVFLNDDLSGPLPLALYSAALFSLTEGRAYSAAEYAAWLAAAGLQVEPPIATSIHCGLLAGRKT